jgi:hypothetical protein
MCGLVGGAGLRTGDRQDFAVIDTESGHMLSLSIGAADISRYLFGL